MREIRFSMEKVSACDRVGGGMGRKESTDSMPKIEEPIIGTIQWMVG
jgi:hypothetical protein